MAEAFDPLKDAQRLIKLAETEKRKFQDDFAEAYSFTMPHRVRPGTMSKTRPNDAAENFLGMCTQMPTDFASDIVDTFMPEHTRWASAEATSAVPEDFVDEATKAIEKDTKIIFDAISASNFYDSVKQGCKDLSISAFGLAISDPGAGDNIHCQVIPLTELLILRSSRGGIGTRFWKLPSITADELLEYVARDKLPKKAQDKLAKPDSTFCFIQGCWRDYSKPGERAWHTITIVDDEKIAYARVEGEGSAPIQVCRWDPDANFAWGIGPGINALPDFRCGDEVEYLKLKALAKNVDPPGTYDDDGVANLSGGVTNGTWIAKLRGSEIEYMDTPQGIDAAVYSVQEIEHRIRRHYYLDEPEQRGKTPPTLGQWADESLRRQRRLATPAAPLWPEFLAEAFQRFARILLIRGEREPIKVGGKAVQLRPVNPLKRAAMQEEAIASERYINSAAMLGVPPYLLMDIGKTAHNLKDSSHATSVVLKTPAEINGGIEQMQKAQAAEALAKTAGSAAPAISAVSGAMNGSGQQQ